ncbi:lysophospholipase L1-like esterase [Actinocorallia herbida]|uniref:Lysophospholipase L1-like esterase n=1 Tax=Actinocorallia herbida TaxID=58109 RepID=A0A3N1CQ50_9ACTN|nr:GDSL-type esterase/lipase family protein [Actinocorallia herbida]ROO83446.1 lysophospholipase L1-like esterase [Actinocorallia herbida]
MMVGPCAGAEFAAPGFAGRAVRQVVHLHRGGTRLRVWFSNRFGREPLRFRAVRAGLHLGGGRVAPGAAALAFGGEAGVEIPPGIEVVSDPVDLAVPDGAELAVTVGVAADGGAATKHPEGLQTGYAREDAAVDAPCLAGAEEFAELHWIRGVDLCGEPAPGEPVIVAFGDSLTDGSGTTPDAHQRYPDHLWRRLGVRVLNTGIGGNRLLANGFGPAGMLRFADDALGVPGVTHVIIALGVNDLGLAGAAGRPAVTAAELIAGYTALAARAREAGVVPVGATLPPFGGVVYPGYHTARGEQTRAEFNAWMRAASGASGAVFPGHLDMDGALRDPARPVLLRDDLHFGDGLHPNDEGARAIAGAVSPAVFGL